MHPIQDQPLSPHQITQLTKAMLSVANIDGIQLAEAALIGQFYETSRTSEMPTTAALMGSPESRQFNVSDLAGSSAEFADTAVLMCLMAAYADGQLSPAERTYVQSLANNLGLEENRFGTLLAQVRDELVSALSHLPDAGSVAVVVKELAAAD